MSLGIAVCVLVFIAAAVFLIAGLLLVAFGGDESDNW